jgi:hypothetical protein
MTPLAAADAVLEPKLRPLRPLARIREAFRYAVRVLRTGEHEVALTFMQGVNLGMNSGYSAALGEFNAALVGQGIDPIRGAS